MPDQTATVDVRGIQIAPRSRIWPPLITLWIIWGSTYLGIALVGESMPPYLSMGLRWASAGLVLAACLVVVKGPSVLRVSVTELSYSALMGSILLGLVVGNVAQAEQHVPSGIAALIAAAAPLVIVVLRRLAGERASRLTLAGVAVGLIGLAFMLLPGGTAPVSGTSDLEAALWSVGILLGVIVWAVVSWRSSRWPLPRNVMTAVAYEMLAGGLCALGIGAVAGERFDFSAGYAWQSWAGLGWLIIASIIGYGSYSWLIQNAPMSLVTTYAYINPAVAVLLGFLVIGEPITSDVVVGLTVVLGGVLLMLRGERSAV